MKHYELHALGKGMIDVTMTATLRPEIIQRTLSSFKTNLFLPTRRYRLIANIDVAPPENEPSLICVCKLLANALYTATLRVSYIPNFAAALRWTWSKVTTTYFFNLEDDFELLVPVDINEMIETMEQCPELAVLRFPKGPATETHCRQSQYLKEPKYIWNGSYYQCPDNSRKREGYYGSPSLIRTAWMQGVLSYLTDLKSPEKQLRYMKSRKSRRHLINDWRFGCWSKPGVKRIMEDIGRIWRAERGLKKNSEQAFTTWKSVK
jgi:hypothetical protein